MPDKTKTWAMIHSERTVVAEMLDGLAPGQWDSPSLCQGWTVKLVAGHILAAAEQTPIKFVSGMAATGFRFDALMQRDCQRLGGLPPDEIVARLRARTTTTNHPPAPLMAMLGEIVVHGEDIRRPLGLPGITVAEATVACLDMYKAASFPVGGKKRIGGLRLVATDCEWSTGAGPEVAGPGASLMLAMTGRQVGLEGLRGEGLDRLRQRMG